MTTVNFADALAYAVATVTSRLGLAEALRSEGRPRVVFWAVWQIVTNKMIAHGTAATREEAFAEVQRRYPTAAKNKAEHARCFHDQIEHERWVEELAKTDPNAWADEERRRLLNEKITGEERRRLLSLPWTGEFVYARSDWRPHPIVERDKRFVYVIVNASEPIRLDRASLEAHGYAICGYLYLEQFFDEAHVEAAKEQEAWRAEFFGSGRWRDEGLRDVGPRIADDLRELGLGDTATPSEVKHAFRARAKVQHPDQGGDATRFRLLVERYKRALAYVEKQTPAWPTVSDVAATAGDTPAAAVVRSDREARPARANGGRWEVGPDGWPVART